MRRVPELILYLIQNEAGGEDEERLDERVVNLQHILPYKILARASAFPISPVPPSFVEPDPVTLETLYWYLPPADKAADLRTIYYRHAAWMYVLHVYKKNWTLDLLTSPCFVGTIPSRRIHSMRK